MFLSLSHSYPNTDILKTKIRQQCSEWGPALRLQVKLGAAGEVIWLSGAEHPGGLAKMQGCGQRVLSQPCTLRSTPIHPRAGALPLRD